MSTSNKSEREAQVVTVIFTVPKDVDSEFIKRWIPATIESAIAVRDLEIKVEPMVEVQV